MAEQTKQICCRCIMNETVPNIVFDEKGECNYCKLHDALAQAYPRGEEGKREWEKLVKRIKDSRGKNRYDCIIGVSGGTDSSYLLWIAKQYGLNPLAVNLDNGWNSDIAVRNIKKVISKLNIDLETYVIDWEEVKDIYRSYMKASLPWADIPSDLAIQASLYKIAGKESVKYILVGNDFRSEGKQPTAWTYGDGRQLRYVHKKYGTKRIKTFPNLTLFSLVYYGIVKRIKMVRPFYNLDYQKKGAQEFLKKEFGWEYYGGHHHESLFTKFVISYWLPRKFNIDKRMITLSAQVRTGEISRDQGLSMIHAQPYDPESMERDKEYVIKKLDFSGDEFKKIWESSNKSFKDYKSYYAFIDKFSKFTKLLFKFILPWKPMFFFEKEIIGKNN